MTAFHGRSSLMGYCWWYWCGCCTIVVLLLPGGVTGSRSSRIRSVDVDLSYRFGDGRLLRKEMEERLTHAKGQRTTKTTTTTTQWNIDVSSSRLYDEGAVETVTLLRRLAMAETSNETDTSSTTTNQTNETVHTTQQQQQQQHPVELSLSMRSDHLSPVGASRVLEELTHAFTSRWLRVRELDLSFNGLTDPTNQLTPTLLRFLQTHVQQPPVHPPPHQHHESVDEEDGKGHIPSLSLHLGRCGIGPLTCHAIAKGIMNRGSSNSSGNSSDTNDHSRQRAPLSLSLYLGGNTEIGDLGTAALAAAMKSRVMENKSFEQEQPSQQQQWDHLDLSNCNVGDIGAVALGLAVSSRRHDVNVYVPCVWDLRYNRLTDEGMVALCGEPTTTTTTTSKTTETAQAFVFPSTLLLDGNPLGDLGVEAWTARILQLGQTLPTRWSLSLRGCGITGIGASALGRWMVQQCLPQAKQQQQQQEQTNAKANEQQQQKQRYLEIDLSGNAIGVLPPKYKKKPSKSQKLGHETKKAASKMMGVLRSNWKGWGLGTSNDNDNNDNNNNEKDDEDGHFGSAESDDEFESLLSLSSIDQSSQQHLLDDVDTATGCGARAIAEAFLEASTATYTDDNDSTANTANADTNHTTRKQVHIHIHLGMRQCHLDRGAAEALAAAVRSSVPTLTLTVDVSGNGLDHDTVQALLGHHHRRCHPKHPPPPQTEDLLSRMAQRYLETRGVLQAARERADRVARANQDDTDHDDDDWSELFEEDDEDDNDTPESDFVIGEEDDDAYDGDE